MEDGGLLISHPHVEEDAEEKEERVHQVSEDKVLDFMGTREGRRHKGVRSAPRTSLRQKRI